jgi:ribitol 2-dehydrogenase
VALNSKRPMTVPESQRRRPCCRTASGIGLATTEAMIAAGAKVVLADRDEKALNETCTRFGDAAIPLVVDLLDAASCASMVPSTLEKAGQIDILR